MTDVRDADLDRAAKALARARKVAVLTGAGISAESGVPTYRSADGLWQKHRLEDVATPEALQRNPRLVWEFYEARRAEIHAVVPNPAHVALAEMEELFEGFSLATQNVDGLHGRAGSHRVLEVHGSLWRAHCIVGCGHVVDPFPFPSPEIPPRCSCGSLLRPSVVLFGEILPADVLAAAIHGARECDVVLSIGTSSVVWPAAGIPLAAIEAGAFGIEVNPEETELTPGFDVSLRGLAGSVVPELLQRMRGLRGSAGAV
jgi:NAD-dependent protein deacetylase/lipoamidase